MKGIALLWIVAVGMVMTLGCGPSADDAARSESDREPATEGGSSADTGHATAVLPFIADDYPRALAEARERGLPLFIESWAPW